ncbi:hypothetical protein QBC38DRAFT_444573 [Podospora fimiseda]|uniref:Uncharacterized protein n=1 Tax=Podospora fimiseda TaxID=252190 RepID=A0AAN7BMW7_9PEZI|nr:hypothetical protein QBC38DRAFT_444573 [Podospora fimiseda]
MGAKRGLSRAGPELNRRDAIIKLFNLAEDKFLVTRTENTDGANVEVVYKAQDSAKAGESSCLGFIRFKTSDDQGGEGVIEIVNRKAVLQPWHLELGASSKGNDETQAGAHGEGLKVAFLVLMRGDQNFNVRCRSGGFNWVFNFTAQGKLVVRLNRMNSEKIRIEDAKSSGEHRKLLVPCAVSCEQDIQVQLAEGSIVKTPNKSLLLEPSLRGTIYLKGLLRKASHPTQIERSASMTRKPLKFGYYFVSGTTTRDRESVATAGEESKAIWAIWVKALGVRPALVEELSSMLNAPYRDYADVYRAESMVDRETAENLKAYLCGRKFGGKWYYSDSEKTTSANQATVQNPRLTQTIKGLGYTPAYISPVYWKVLRRYDLVRTTAEEERRRFMNAQPVASQVFGTDFAGLICRLLSACLRSCPVTEKVNVRFVRAGKLKLKSYLSKPETDSGTLTVHEQWLTYEDALKELGLPEDESNINDGVFHAVKTLFEDALAQIPDERFELLSVRRRQRRRAGRAVYLTHERTAKQIRNSEHLLGEQRIFEFFRIETTWGFDINPSSASLRAFWFVPPVEFLAANIAKSSVNLELHLEETCSHLRDKYLIGADMIATPACKSEQCRKKEDDVPFTSGSHTFDNLKTGQHYFYIIRMVKNPAAFVFITPPIFFPAPPLRITTFSRPPGPENNPVTYWYKTLGPELERVDVHMLSNGQWYDAVQSDNGDVKALVSVLDTRDRDSYDEPEVNDEPEINDESESVIGKMEIEYTAMGLIPHANFVTWKVRKMGNELMKEQQLERCNSFSAHEQSRSSVLDSVSRMF